MTIGVDCTNRQSLIDRLEERYKALSSGAISFGGFDPGFANGLAGVAYSFLRTGDVTGNSNYTTLARHLLTFAVANEHLFEAPPDGEQLVFNSNSLFFSPASLWVLLALVYARFGDLTAAGTAAVEYLRFIEKRPYHGMDLTLGEASVLLGCTILIETIGFGVVPQLDDFAGDVYSDLMVRLLGSESLGRDTMDISLAHGWAGIIYGMARYSRATRQETPQEVLRAADQIATLGIEAFGNDMAWCPVAGEPLDGWAPVSWCNGSSGTIHLFALLHEMTGIARYLELAVKTALFIGKSVRTTSWNVCCGLSGQSYALWRIASLWDRKSCAKRATELAELAAARFVRQPNSPFGPHSLMKGEVGVALLAIEVASGEIPRMPLIDTK